MCVPVLLMAFVNFPHTYTRADSVFEILVYCVCTHPDTHGNEINMPVETYTQGHSRQYEKKSKSFGSWSAYLQVRPLFFSRFMVVVCLFVYCSACNAHNDNTSAHMFAQTQ